jgi:hypothetical protein
MASIESDILKWLRDNNIDDCAGLRDNAEFTSFLNGIFPGKSQDEIIAKVRQCCIAFRGNLENFVDCVATGLSN